MRKTKEEKLNIAIDYLSQLGTDNNDNIPILISEFDEFCEEELDGIGKDIRREAYNRCRIRYYIDLWDSDNMRNSYDTAEGEIGYPELSLSLLRNAKDLKNVADEIILDEIERYKNDMRSMEESVVAETTCDEKIREDKHTLDNTRKKENREQIKLSGAERLRFLEELYEKKDALLSLLDSCERSEIPANGKSCPNKLTQHQIEILYKTGVCKKGVDKQLNILVPRTIDRQISKLEKATGWSRQKIGQIAIQLLIDTMKQGEK